MTVIAGIAIDAEDCAIGQVLSHTTTRIDLTQFTPVESQLIPYFWKEVGGNTDTFERQVRADDRVEALRNLDGRVNAHLYSIEWAEEIDGFLTALRDHDILVEEGWTTDDGDRLFFRLRAWDQTELSSFQTACFEADVRLDIRRVHHNPDTGSGGTPRLSDEQREALVVALRRGYFDIPRSHSQTEIAEELGISRQAFSRRLRRAQRSTFEDLLWDEVDQ